MQTELVRSEKTAALGSLVAGIAHELNTPIGTSVLVASTMQSGVETLLNEFELPKPRRTFFGATLKSVWSGFEILMNNLERSAALVSSFKQIAVDQTSDRRRIFDLRTLVEEVIMTLEPIYRKSPYKMALDLAPDLTMDSYPGALGQVITNFVNNALTHAFEGREQGDMLVLTRALGVDRVELIFSDNGIGIAEANIDRVFDPFFTTKLGQGGSGLGMSIVYNLVCGPLGGTVSLSSSPGEGTRIAVSLPLLAPNGSEAIRTPLHTTHA
jgi:signal transduction histidine kinase